MKQAFLSGDGQIEVLDAPVPRRLPGGALVRNAYSLISSGTEGAAVTHRGGLLGTYEKAMQSRHRVQQVWRMAKTQGAMRTFTQVRGKLADLTPLGYSAAGLVVETDEAGQCFSVGQRVAYMGTGLASHAEYGVAMPLLSAPLPDHVPLDQASFGALACIAMQGLRRAELSPGERVLIIGLGLVGQLAVRLGQAMGYRVFGTDLSTVRVLTAAKTGITAWTPSDGEATAILDQYAGGEGFDAAVICAGSKDGGLINDTFDLLRKGGRVSIVGAVSLELERARMYRKELEVRLSCSYGPGRYDPDYELDGHDYPIQHARWTEGRNLELFIDLLATGRLDLSDLVSRMFSVADAKQAFAEVKSAKAEVFGILLGQGLPADPVLEARPTAITLSAPPKVTTGDGPVRIGVIGVGGYANGMHLPNLTKLEKNFTLSWLASRSGVAAPAKRFKPRAITSDYRTVLDCPDTEAVLISVRHAGHAKLLIEALDAGKHVFIEKPMTRTVTEAKTAVALAERTGLVVRVGFNRRFSPDMRALREIATREGPAQFLARCSTGPLGADWSNEASEGGRLLGEGTHFMDLCNWMMGAEPMRLSADLPGPDAITNPNAGILLKYPGNKAAQIVYTALGSKAFGKEYYEIHGGGASGWCRDFLDTKFFGVKGAKGVGKGDKGQLDALREFGARIRGRDHPVQGADARAGLLATWMAWATRASARHGRAFDCLESLEKDLIDSPFS